MVVAAGGQDLPGWAERHPLDKAGWAGLAMFHSQTLPSSLPAARIFPSGLNATEVTTPVMPMGWSGGVGRGWLVSSWSRRAGWAGLAMFHSQTLWSLPLAA